MPKPRNPKPTPAKLRVAYKKDLSSAWNYFLRKYPDHTPYAFVLYGVEGTPRLSPHVLTEQSLTKVAQKYLDDGYYDTLDDARSALRYSVPDSPLSSELEDQLTTVDAIVEPHATTLDEASGYALLAKAAIAAFKELDEEGVFGTSAERERLLLAIITEATEEDWTKRSARRLNPKSVYQRFDDETRVEGTFTSCADLAASSDGRWLFVGGSRKKEGENLHPNHNTDWEIFALDLQCQRFDRRWTFTFPGVRFGERCEQLVCPPDGQTVIALCTSFRNRTDQSLLLRFSNDSNVPLQQCRLPGVAACFAASNDGSRIAVATLSRTIHLLDYDFRLLQSINLELEPHGILFQRSGHLLVATGQQLLRLATLTFTVEKSIPLASFRMAADDSETVLAVSAWFMDRKDEFGVHLLSLPSLEPIRTCLIPGHQAVTATLSPDGCLLAFEAHQIGKHRHIIAVFNTATGQEVARKKAGFIHDLLFLRDNRTLAIAEGRFTKTEAIELWNVPNTSPSVSASAT